LGKRLEQEGRVGLELERVAQRTADTFVSPNDLDAFGRMSPAVARADLDQYLIRIFQ
jgi:hypothetical protein